MVLMEAVSLESCQKYFGGELFPRREKCSCVQSGEQVLGRQLDNITILISNVQIYIYIKRMCSSVIL